jgi:histidine triad (HIT) family protein
VLVITKAHHADLPGLVAADPGLAARVLGVTSEVAKAEGVAESGYRVVFNVGPDSGQEVAHVHAHVLGGRHMGGLG